MGRPARGALRRSSTLWAVGIGSSLRTGAEVEVVDIPPSSISDCPAFVNAVNDALAAGTVTKFLSPNNGDPAYHIEF